MALAVDFTAAGAAISLLLFQVPYDMRMSTDLSAANKKRILQNKNVSGFRRS
jgi:hypothetical protein